MDPCSRIHVFKVLNHWIVEEPDSSGGQSLHKSNFGAFEIIFKSGAPSIEKLNYRLPFAYKKNFK